MRVELNLASRPFGRSRLFWLSTGAAGLVLVALAVGLIAVFVDNRALPESVVAAEAQARAELAELTAKQSTLNVALRSDETIDVYDRSYFLNQLLLRKGISWTRTFADLEQVLPPRVLMLQIRPEVTFDNQVELEMQVGAETPADFIEFVKSLEGSAVFGPPEVRGYVPPNDNDPYYRYNLRVRYEQQL